MQYENLKWILKAYYDINGVEIEEVQGGWAARAFKVTQANQSYFLKMYEKHRAATIKWTQDIDDYTKILIELSQTNLRNSVPETLLTNNQKYKCEDAYGIYILYQYIDGETIAEHPLTIKQTKQLGDIVGRLHATKIDRNQIRNHKIESFEIPFNRCLNDYLENLEEDYIYDAIKVYLSTLKKLVVETFKVSDYLKRNKNELEFVVCHTDIHNWNLMNTKEEKLILIDWEGLTFAPREADFFFLVDLPYYEAFYVEYEKHTQWQKNDDCLWFYRLRRKSEDIWEFVQQLLEEQLEEAQQKEIIQALLNECREAEVLLGEYE